MELTEMVKGLLGEIRQLTESESVVGKPIKAGDNVIIPVTKLTIGFGTGQGQASSKQGSPVAGGAGGGISLDPQGFLVVDKEGRASLLSLSDAKRGALLKAIEAVPQVVEKLVASKSGQKLVGALNDGDSDSDGSDEQG